MSCELTIYPPSSSPSLSLSPSLFPRPSSSLSLSLSLPPLPLHRPAAPYPSTPVPLFRSLALLLDQGYLEVDKGWLMSTESNVCLEQLPHWMGQITLKGVVTDRVSTLAQFVKHEHIH